MSQTYPDNNGSYALNSQDSRNYQPPDQEIKEAALTRTQSLSKALGPSAAKGPGSKAKDLKFLSEPTGYEVTSRPSTAQAASTPPFAHEQSRPDLSSECCGFWQNTSSGGRR